LHNKPKLFWHLSYLLLLLLLFRRKSKSFSKMTSLAKVTSKNFIKSVRKLWNK
jgi:hypothetical protein